MERCCYHCGYSITGKHCEIIGTPNKVLLHFACLNYTRNQGTNKFKCDICSKDVVSFDVINHYEGYSKTCKFDVGLSTRDMLYIHHEMCKDNCEHNENKPQPVLSKMCKPSTIDTPKVVETPSAEVSSKLRELEKKIDKLVNKPMVVEKVGPPPRIIVTRGTQTSEDSSETSEESESSDEEFEKV
uniref:Uncharacterized protein n=1 Tax=viral metagenome TaxID=1070528 RepID=A0A6C0CJI0_9ZZZZ